MSGTVFWRPVSGGKRIGCGSASHFRTVMTRVFGEPPWRLDGEAYDRLAALAATIEPGDRSRDNPYQEIIEALELMDGDPIEVYLEY